MTPINHLQRRIDELGWRIEQANENTDRRRLEMDCVELERAIQVHEHDLLREVADLESAKQALHRLKAHL